MQPLFDMPDSRATGQRRRYVKRAASFVVAVQLALQTKGFTYEKWGGTQTCKPGDWVVSNNGDTYTVDRDSFERTYKNLSPGLYRKTTPIWAEVAQQAGNVQTKEGVTSYKAGDYLVSNDQEGKDPYAISKTSFDAMYELAHDS
jgi:hypothetical protein